MVRTKEEFDKWYNDNYGDPWGYKGWVIKKRLESSMELIKRNISKDYYGAIYELGGFNGDFTKLLAEYFKDCIII